MLGITLFLCIFLGLIGGALLPELMLNLQWIDTLFINLLKLIVIPLIFCVLVSTIISMGKIKCLKAVWIYTICYFVFSIIISLLITLVLMNIFQPGKNISVQIINPHIVASQLEKLNSNQFFTAFLPVNAIKNAASLEILPIIIFAIACISVGESTKPISILFIAVSKVLKKIITWLMYCTPIVLFILLGVTIIEAYLRKSIVIDLYGLFLFVVVCLLALCCQFLWQFVILKCFVKKQVSQILKNSSSAMFAAFTTSSSLAALPTSLLIVKEANLAPEIAEFSLPLATIINCSSTSMYEAISAIFFCQILNINLSLFAQVSIFLLPYWLA